MPAHRIAIGADHGGFELKTALLDILTRESQKPIDLGTFSPEPCNYPLFSQRVAAAVSGGLADLGIIICKSGNGVSIVANRYPGVRAAYASDSTLARLAREHNHANVLVLGAEYLAQDVSEVVLAWLRATPQGGRHGQRVAIIDRQDRQRLSGLATVRMNLANQQAWLTGVEDPALRGDLRTYVENAAVCGLAFDWTWLENTIADALRAHSPIIAHLKAEQVPVAAACEELMVDAVRKAADVLRPAFSQSGGDMGHVSVSVDPAFHDTDERLFAEVRRLAARYERPNVIFDIPANAVGTPVIERLSAAGIGTRVVHVFSEDQYALASGAFLRGLLARQYGRYPVQGIPSFASVDIAALAPALDDEIGRVLAGDLGGGAKAMLLGARPGAWIHHARSLYLAYRKRFFADEYAGLLASGASVQRLQWTARGPDSVLFLKELVIPFTSCGMTQAAVQELNAIAGVRCEVTPEDFETSSNVMETLLSTGIDFSAAGARLQAAAVEADKASHAGALQALERALAT